MREKYRLMIFDFDLCGWKTIAYPRNITEAKHMGIDGAKFCFGNNPNYKMNDFEAKYRLMIFDFDLCSWRTIGYPRNITEAKHMGKEYLIYS